MTEITLEMLKDLNSKLRSSQTSNTPRLSFPATHQSKKQNITIGVNSSNAMPETPQEIAKLKSALELLSADVPRGQGKLYVSGQDNPDEHHWLIVMWAIASLGWASGKQIARDWSMQSSRYEDDGFESAWDSYDPLRANAIGIGSLFKRAQLLGWNSSATLNSPPNSNRYKLLGSDEINALPPMKWAIKNILPEKGVAAIFGPSGSGKSFLTLSLATSIAAKKPWFGIRTYGCPVVYVMLEGETGLRNRLAAWERENGQKLPTNFHIVIAPFLLTSQDVMDLAIAAPHGSAIFIDTFNRAAPTTDENSSKEMGAVLSAVKELQSLTDGLVVVIHHTGKDSSKGMRGHSSLHAALDAAIEVERTGNNRAWSIAKAKDGEDGKSVPFVLKVHVLGIDTDGDEITSCTIGVNTSNIFIKKEPQGARQKSALKIIRAELCKSQIKSKGDSGSSSCMRVEDAIVAVAASLTTESPNRRKNRAKGHVDGLIASGHLESSLDNDEGWLWIT